MASCALQGLHSLALAADRLSASDTPTKPTAIPSRAITLPAISILNPEVTKWSPTTRSKPIQPQMELPPFKELLSHQHLHNDIPRKMSLQFIAPISDSGGSWSPLTTPLKQEDGSASPDMPSSVSSISSAPTSTYSYLPSPVWSTSSSPECPGSPASHYRESHPAAAPTSPISPTFPTVAASPASRSSGASGPREDRHPYDDDERYALLHFRTIQSHKWEQVVFYFRELFPPGSPRRCNNASSRGCPPNYAVRYVQGLQCRFYRIREEEGMKRLRDTRGAGFRRDHAPDPQAPPGGYRRERDILERMVREGRVSPVIIKACKAMEKEAASRR